MANPAWDRLPDETNKAYLAFKCYLELGVRRSLVKAAECSGAARQSCEIWSVKYNWQTRIREFEQTQTRQYVGNNLDMIALNQEQIQKDMLADTQAMLAWWRQEIIRYKENPSYTNDEGIVIPVAVDPKQMKLFFDARRTIDDLARRAIGLPAQNPVSNVQQDIKELPPEDRQIKFLGIPMKVDKVQEDEI